MNLLKEELTLERVKVAQLQSLLELEKARETPSPRGLEIGTKSLLGMDQGWVPPTFARAYARMKKGDRKGALADFKAFLESHPHHPLADDAMYYMALGCADMGKDKEALTLLRELVQKYPKSDRVSQAKLKIGLILIGQGKIKEGEKEIEKVLEGSPFVLGGEKARALLEGEEK